LQKKSNIPAVQKKMSVLKKVAHPDYWRKPTPKLAEQVRLEIRDLMRYLDRPTQDIVMTNFTDRITKFSESRGVYEATSFNKDAYRKKVERYIRENRHNITIDKLRRNEPVTEQEIEALEDML